jgi:hypothetical protein
MVSCIRTLDKQEVCLTFEKIQYPATLWSQKYQTNFYCAMLHMYSVTFQAYKNECYVLGKKWQEYAMKSLNGPFED